MGVGMYKNQLQELAQRSCFNLPSYACMREGPDHAPRFKATVNFNGEMFESPTYFSTLRLAEHAAAGVALNTLAKRGPSKTLASKVLDETGVYKNLLQETAHRAGLNLPVYTTVRSGPGHVPVFSCTVDLAGMTFTGEPAKTKKQAQKNAAMSAWSALKQMSQRSTQTVSTDSGCHEEQEQAVVARFLATIKPAESNYSTQSNQQKGHLKSSTPVTTFSRSFSSFPSSFKSNYQNWASPNLPLDMANHHIWLQEQQRHLLPLGVPIPSGLPPRELMPWMQSMVQPSHLPYCFTGEEQPFSVRPGISFQTASSSIFSNQPVRDPIKTASIVNIQELHELKTDHNSKLCPLQGNNSSIMMDEKLIEGKQDSLPQTEKLASAPLEVQDKGSLEVASSRCVSSEIQPVETWTQSPPNVESSSANIRLAHVTMSSYHGNAGLASPTVSQAAPFGSRERYWTPPLTASVMQSNVRPYLMRPILGRMQTGHFHGPLMAPAVQIRSVVPVCSAPSPRRMPSSNQERSQSHNVRNTTTGDVQIMNSSMENLHI